jgi:tetratricopeptide (TPR) repeat protein
LVDDPEYLLLCSEAWLADGDTLRAQQALLGAARLSPEDPRPLQCLGELLAERGEHDKAELVLAKARELEAVPADPRESLHATGPEAEDDLIAYAETQERRHQATLAPRHIVLGVLALAAVTLLIVGIAAITRPAPRKAASPPRGSAPAPAAIESPKPIRSMIAEEVTQEAAIETVEPELVPRPAIVHAAEVETAPPDPEPSVAVDPPRAAAPPAEPKVKPKPRAKAAPVPETKEPDAAVVEAELASMDPRQLTTRADALSAQGHSALATTYYRRALEIDPDYAPALVGIGQSVLRAKKYSEAMRNATRALHLARGVDARPGLEATAIYQLGRVHYERGERDAARHLFRQSISLPGTPPDAWFYLAEALSSDNSPAARHAYEEYIELVPAGHLADRARRAIR